ncbi:hypothetical protein BOVAC1_4598 [Bacteroides ovatus]|nr:hypothetical protein BOVAC1_4598 [Bacteroides ovatus]CAG9898694.1 hypothetical protein BOVA713_3147 [Bacteroides ovatus]
MMISFSAKIEYSSQNFFDRRFIYPYLYYITLKIEYRKGDGE